ncbi:hypothetical protein HMPREF1326_01033 [Akkermansia sp. KLE1605]|nr:hypothetical protein HMPREF1326_01033 [Akkermansia sp. KLE1605]
MHTEVPRKGLHAFPGGGAGTASPFGERVQKLYGLVIRCSNTLSPNPGAFPFLFPAPKGKFSADSPCRAFIPRRRIAADGHLTFRRQISRIARGMVETGSQVDIPAPSPAAAHQAAVQMAEKDRLRFRKETVGKPAHARHHRQPCQENLHGPLRRPCGMRQKAHQPVPVNPGACVNGRNKNTHGAGQLQTAAQVRIRVRKGGNQLAGYTLVFQVFPPPRSHFLEQGMAVERVKTAALQFQQAEFLIGVMVARQQDGLHSGLGAHVQKTGAFFQPFRLIGAFAGFAQVPAYDQMSAPFQQEFQFFRFPGQGLGMAEVDVGNKPYAFSRRKGKFLDHERRMAE